MAVQAVVLVSSSVLAAGTFTGSSKTFNGGRGVIVLNAAAYGATVNLQVQHQNGVWVNMNSTTYSADQVTAYDLPGGQYRMNCSGSTAGLSATLVEIAYI